VRSEFSALLCSCCTKVWPLENTKISIEALTQWRFFIMVESNVFLTHQVN